MGFQTPGKPQASYGCDGDAVFEPLIDFLDSVNGRGRLVDGLRCIADYLGADSALITRSPGGRGAVRVVDSYERHASFAAPRSLASDLLGSFFDRLRPGTWCLASQHLAESDGAEASLAAILAEKRLVDAGIIVLESSANVSDYVELFFSRPPREAQLEKMEAMGRLLSRLWRMRKPGLVTAQLAGRSAAITMRPKLTGEVGILADGNPAGLTRTEFRVCVLVGRGLSITAIAGELDVSVSTVRTHLRSIYQKTECSGFNQLAYRLISVESRTDPAVPLARTA